MQPVVTPTGIRSAPVLCLSCLVRLIVRPVMRLTVVLRTVARLMALLILLVPTAMPQRAHADESLSASAQEPKACGLAERVSQRVGSLLTAQNHTHYQGTILVEFGGDREFVAVDSSLADGTGSLLRLNHQVDAQPTQVTLLALDRPEVCDLARFYAFSMEPGQVVAGRETYRLTIRPKDTLRLGYVMDVDVETDIPLRVVTATSDGQVLERFEFAAIAVSTNGSKVDDAQTAEGGAETPASGLQRTNPGNDNVVEPGYRFAALPPGFEVVGRGITPTDFLVVSDGLASVSVFVEPRPAPLTDGEGVVLRGATLAYTRGTSTDFLITVMGEVPVTTARLLADAVRTTRR